MNEQDPEEMKRLSDEENLQFQHYMMQKTLTHFHLTESQFINDFMGMTYLLILELIDLLGIEKLSPILEECDQGLVKSIEVMDHYFSLLSGTEGLTHEENE